MSKTIYVISTRKIGPRYFFNDTCGNGPMERRVYKRTSEENNIFIYGYRCPDGIYHDIQDRLTDYCQDILEDVNDNDRLVFLLHDKDIQPEDIKHFRYRSDRILNVLGRQMQAHALNIYGYTHNSESVFGNFLINSGQYNTPLEFHCRLREIIQLFEVYDKINTCNDRETLAQIDADNDMGYATLIRDTSFSFSDIRGVISEQIYKKLQDLGD